MSSKTATTVFVGNKLALLAQNLQTPTTPDARYYIGPDLDTEKVQTAILNDVYVEGADADKLRLSCQGRLHALIALVGTVQTQLKTTRGVVNAPAALVVVDGHKLTVIPNWRLYNRIVFLRFDALQRWILIADLIGSNLATVPRWHVTMFNASPSALAEKTIIEEMLGKLTNNWEEYELVEISADESVKETTDESVKKTTDESVKKTMDNYMVEVIGTVRKRIEKSTNAQMPNDYDAKNAIFADLQNQFTVQSYGLLMRFTSFEPNDRHFVLIALVLVRALLCHFDLAYGWKRLYKNQAAERLVDATLETLNEAARLIVNNYQSSIPAWLGRAVAQLSNWLPVPSADVMNILRERLAPSILVRNCIATQSNLFEIIVNDDEDDAPRRTMDAMPGDSDDALRMLGQTVGYLWWVQMANLQKVAHIDVTNALRPGSRHAVIDLKLGRAMVAKVFKLKLEDEVDHQDIVHVVTECLMAASEYTMNTEDYYARIFKCLRGHFAFVFRQGGQHDAFTTLCNTLKEEHSDAILELCKSSQHLNDVDDEDLERLRIQQVIVGFAIVQIVLRSVGSALRRKYFIAGGVRQLCRWTRPLLYYKLFQTCCINLKKVVGTELFEKIADRYKRVLNYMPYRYWIAVQSQLYKVFKDRVEIIQLLVGKSEDSYNIDEWADLAIDSNFQIPLDYKDLKLYKRLNTDSYDNVLNVQNYIMDMNVSQTYVQNFVGRPQAVQKQVAALFKDILEEFVKMLLPETILELVNNNDTQAKNRIDKIREAYRKVGMPFIGAFLGEKSVKECLKNYKAEGPLLIESIQEIARKTVKYDSVKSDTENAAHSYTVIVAMDIFLKVGTMMMAAQMQNGDDSSLFDAMNKLKMGTVRASLYSIRMPEAGNNQNAQMSALNVYLSSIRRVLILHALQK